MIASGDSASHEEAWLALPWLANGRLSQAERAKVEPHVRACVACSEELAFQRLLCNALTEPDRVTYAPGPSFRKLMDRIDAPVTPIRRRSDSRVALWRPPGLAWAASFVLAVGLGGIITTVYHSSRPFYVTHTDSPHVVPTVLHMSFNHSVTVGEAEEALRSSGARVVKGPDSSGVIGVQPNTLATGKPTAEQVSQELRVLSAHLRADPRVRWIEPVPGDNTPGEAQAPPHRGP